jgi:hypothetical protein
MRLLCSRSSSSGPLRAGWLLLGLGLFVLPAAAWADFTVNDATSDPDVLINGTCATANGTCSLRAALQEANAAAGLDNITFSGVTVITLTANLPEIIFPVSIDGSSGSPRVQLDGGRVNNLGGFQCLSFDDGAGGSTVESMNIRNCGGAGIALVGFGYTITDNYLGVTADGESAAGNGGAGLSITTVAEDWPYPALPPIPSDLSAIATAATAALSAALSLPPNTVTDNVISGNAGDGVDIFAENTTLNVLSGNFIGTDKDGVSAIPNGTAGGIQHGVSIGGNAWGNVIGPGNVISGNTEFGSNGVAIDGTVPWPNVVTGNIVGPSATLVTDLGNDEAGIRVSARPSPPPQNPGDPPENTTGFSALIGPLNIVGYNKGSDTTNPDSANNAVGGITVLGNTTRRVKVYGNFVGLAEDLISSGTFLDLGNATDGINVSASDNEIGGSLPFEANFIGSNGLHGIAIRGTQTFDNVVRGNFIGVNPLLELVGFGNGADGIFVPNASNTVIGGPGLFDANLIAGNGRHGIRLGTSGVTGGSSNWITRNSIYGNAGLGIDIDGDLDDPDVTNDDDPDPSDANQSQNAPVLSAASYDSGTGATGVTYTFHSAPSRAYVFEVFASEAGDPDASGRTFLGAFGVTTDAMGDASGTSAVTPVSPLNSAGLKVTVTATDVSLGNTPNGDTNVPLDNTSELSNAVTVPQPGELRFTAATAAFSAAENAGTVMFMVERVNGADGTVSVDFQVSDGTAGAPDDYTATMMGTLTWMDGETAAQGISVNIVPDDLDEADETVLSMLSNAQGGAAIVSPSMATLTILDDDAEPALSIDDVSTTEGNAGTKDFTFTVSLSAASGKNVSFTAATADGTATLLDSDYVQLAATTFDIPAGATSVPVTVQVNGDTVDEMADETFAVNLSSPVNATIADAQGLGTIVNDDGALPTLSIDDPSVSEGDAGDVLLTFTITRSPATGASTVNAATVAGGTATGGGVDYDDLAATPVSFADLEASKTVSVTVKGDTDPEPDETVFVQLSGATGATIGDGDGVGTILDDDAPAPSVTVNDPSVAEGDAGTATLTFTLTRTPTGGASSVSVATQDGTATAGVDYVALAATQVDFVDGQGQATVDVTVNGDLVFEGNETVLLNVSTVANANVTDGQGSGTILDDDSQPTLSIDDVSIDEGDGGTTAFTFTVTLSNPSAQTVQVNAASADNTATLGDNDYEQLTSTQLTFAPLDVTETVTVQVNGDTMVEGDETFFVNLSGASNATVLDGQGVGTIQNDDAAGPSFSISDVTALEGNAGDTAFSFDVTRTDTVGPASVTASTADGTATAGSDYTAAAGLVVFGDGEGTVQVVVQVTGETVFETDETFFVNLSAPSAGYALADDQGVGTITNDDTQPVVSIGDVTDTEGNAGGKTFSFPVTLSNASTQTVTVSAATADGSATVGGGDYVGLGPVTVTFPPLSTVQSFDVTVNGDTTIEGDESFLVNLSAPGNATLGDAQGVGTVLNDDSADKSFNGPTATGTGIASGTFSGGGAACGFVTADLLAAPPGSAPVPPTAPPGGWVFPHGLVAFEIDGCTPASTLDFTLTFPQPLPPGAVFWKYGPTPSNPTPDWYQLPAVIAGNVVTFSITDGGLGDSDLTANGAVVDPGGPAYLSSAVAIPTIDWRGLAALLLLLGAVGVVVLRGGAGRV